MAYTTAAPARATRTLEVAGPPQCNVLIRSLGIRALSHLPCRFDCKASAELGSASLTLGRELGFGREMDWLLEILDWPMEWSSLHGIAEIRIPILKVSTATDATAVEYVVRRAGNGYPAEGARGLGFPYRSPTRPRLTASVAFRDGLASALGEGDRPVPRPGALTADDLPAVAPDARCRDLEGDLLLYRHKDAPGVTLNRSARAVLDLCDGRRDLWAICCELGARYGVHGSLFIGDVREVVAELAGLGWLGLVRRTGGDEPTVDWTRIATISTDGYDVDQALAFAARQREPLPHAWPGTAAPCLPGTGIRLAHCYPHTRAGMVNAPLDHPNPGRAVHYLQVCWAEVLEPMQKLVACVHPVIDPRLPTDDRAFLGGVYNHADESRFGTLWASINCPLMLADSLVHELAHIKLFALGVYKESCLRLVENDPGERFHSPVIADLRRPMMAVVHGTYAFTHVTELNVRVLPTLTDPYRRDKLARRLKRNLDLVGEGMATIDKGLKADRAGQRWCDDLRRRAATIL